MLPLWESVQCICGCVGSQIMQVYWRASSCVCVCVCICVQCIRARRTCRRPRPPLTTAARRHHRWRRRSARRRAARTHSTPSARAPAAPAASAVVAAVAPAAPWSHDARRPAALWRGDPAHRERGLWLRHRVIVSRPDAGSTFGMMCTARGGRQHLFHFWYDTDTFKGRNRYRYF